MEDETGPIRLVEEGSLIRLVNATHKSDFRSLANRIWCDTAPAQEGDPEIEYLGPEDLMLASTSQILTQAPPQAHRSLPQARGTTLLI
jgi:hypothetical protein